MSGRSIKRAIASPGFNLPLQSGQMGSSGSIRSPHRGSDFSPYMLDQKSVPLGVRATNLDLIGSSTQPRPEACRTSDQRKKKIVQGSRAPTRPKPGRPEALRFGVDVAARCGLAKCRATPQLSPITGTVFGEPTTERCQRSRPSRRSARVRVRSCPKTFVAVPAPSGGVSRPGRSRFHTGPASASPADGRQVGGTRGSARC